MCKLPGIMMGTAIWIFLSAEGFQILIRVPTEFYIENNKGVFTDVTANVCPALERPGMITGAVWTDFDNDKQTDLVIAGEWMPVRFFKNENKKLKEVTGSTGLTNGNGMWRSLIATDIDNDGDIDFVAGNQGLNCDYHTSPAQPMQLYAADIDHNGSIDPVLFYYLKDKNGEKRSFPAIGLNQFASQVPLVKKKYLLFKNYAKANYDDLFKGNTQRQHFRI